CSSTCTSCGENRSRVEGGACRVVGGGGHSPPSTHHPPPTTRSEKPMNSEVAGVMDRVLLCGLDLKDRLEKGEKLDIAVEQTQLRALLKSESEARRWPEYGGDSAIGGTTIGGQRAQAFAGIRYALTSWLDEIFIADSRWSEEWRDKALELDLYGEVLRYDRFWEQARRAESRPGTDALEGYFLCTMLGFRGRNVGAPEQLQAWCDSVEPRITS